MNSEWLITGETCLLYCIQGAPKYTNYNFHIIYIQGASNITRTPSQTYHLYTVYPKTLL